MPVRPFGLPAIDLRVRRPRGGAVSSMGRPRPLAGTNARKGSTRAARPGPVPLLFDNSVVGHTRIQVRCGVSSSSDGADATADEGFTLHPRETDRDASHDWFDVQGEWHTPQHSFTPHRRESRRRRRMNTNPLGSGSHKGPRPRPASRDAGIERLGRRKQPADRFHAFPGAEARSAWSSS